MITCKNCTTAYEGDFCYHCGQAAATGRITVRQILRDTFFSVVQVNWGFLFTVKELTRRPDGAIREYIAGKRLPYYAPHKYLFLMGAVATFLTARYHPFSGEYSLVARQSGEFLSNFWQYADAYTTVVNVVSVPVFALFSWLLFRAWAYNYAENLVLNVYITSQQLLLFILLVPVLELMPSASAWLLPVYTLLTVLYNGWVYVQFFQPRYSWHGILRSAGAILPAYAGQLLLNLLVFYGQSRWPW